MEKASRVVQQSLAVAHMLTQLTGVMNSVAQDFPSLQHPILWSANGWQQQQDVGQQQEVGAARMSPLAATAPAPAPAQPAPSASTEAAIRCANALSLEAPKSRGKVPESKKAASATTTVASR